MLSIE
ncbi:Protein of unknown function [Bacillus mycoides]|jgi:hypothetical protein